MSETIATTQEWFESHLSGDYKDAREESARLTLESLELREKEVARHVVEQSRFAVAGLFKELADELW